MSVYQFETDQFGITEGGIHLLRSRFNYETIEFTEVNKISIHKGKQVNNWLLLLVLGLGLFGTGLYAAVKIIYEYFFADNFRLFYTEQFILPVLPLILGAVSVYFSMMTGPVLTVTVKNKSKRFPLYELKKKSQLDALITFFMSHPLTKNTWHA